jgi:F-type H+-transporting ATPase subunit b
MIDINITLLIQAVNFLVLYWILDAIFFKPLFRVMDERREKFASLAEGFSVEKSQIADLEAQVQSQVSSIYIEANALKVKARKEAELQRESLLDHAQVKANEARQVKTEGFDKNLGELETVLEKQMGELSGLMKDHLLQSPARRSEPHV